MCSARRRPSDASRANSIDAANRAATVTALHSTRPAGRHHQGAAPIDDVQIVIAKSLPPQYSLSITAGLPGGCAKFDAYTVKRDGDVITVTVTNTMPSDPLTACTRIYGFNKFDVPLGSDFEAGKSYTVKVNDAGKTFVA